MRAWQVPACHSSPCSSCTTFGGKGVTHGAKGLFARGKLVAQLLPRDPAPPCRQLRHPAHTHATKGTHPHAHTFLCRLCLRARRSTEVCAQECAAVRSRKPHTAHHAVDAGRSGVKRGQGRGRVAEGQGVIKEDRTTFSLMVLRRWRATHSRPCRSWYMGGHWPEKEASMRRHVSFSRQ